MNCIQLHKFVINHEVDESVDIPTKNYSKVESNEIIIKKYNEHEKKFIEENDKKY